MSQSEFSDTENSIFEDVSVSDDTQLTFVSLLKKYIVVLEKSQLPNVKTAKTKAISGLCSEYKSLMGKDIDEKKMMKKINNMKSEVKKKTDKNRTGNAKIILKNWEKQFVELLSPDNPSVNCIPVSGGSILRRFLYREIKSSWILKSRICHSYFPLCLSSSRIKHQLISSRSKFPLYSGNMPESTALDISTLPILTPKVDGRIYSILKSPADKREYLGLVLENKMKILLISDPTTDISAASLTVAAGSMNEPMNLPGLAHFCEHMLFLGTEKYPEENDFDKFLTENGGSSNAYTDEDHTNYYFDIAPQSLSVALDRFAQFFISPLFTESGTEREVNAVNSEHEKNIPDDAWRYSEILKVTSKPEHPYSKFNVGSRSTLWTKPREKSMNVRDALMAYHNSYYSANLMTLSVLGTESLDELKALVEPMFSPVKNNDAILPRWPESPYGPSELRTWIDILPIKDLREMALIFPIPDTTKFYKSASVAYMSHLVGHEGQGSLLSLLKEKNWVNELSCGGEVPARGFGAFSVDVELTPDGLQHREDVITHIFQYLEMLRRNGPEKWIWEEERDVQAIKFQFLDTQIPQDYVSSLTSKMISYPLDEVLSAGYHLSEYNPKQITEIMNLLIPENCRVVLTTQENEDKVNQTEEHYGIKYSTRKIDDKLIEKWKNCGFHDRLALPLKNDFIPSEFVLKPRNDQGIIPELIMDARFSRVWFLQDNEFLLPKGMVRLEMYSPLPLQDPLSHALNHMLRETVNDALTEYSYAATIAGLEYTLTCSHFGLEIFVAGYNHKLGILLERILKKIINFTCDAQRFEVLRESYIRYIKNWEIEQPRKHASYYLTCLLREKRWTRQEISAVMNDVTFDNLEKYSCDFLANLKLEWLIYGNYTIKESKEFVLNCHEMLDKRGTTTPLSSEKHVRLGEVMLEQGADYTYKKQHENHSDSCITVLYQSGIQCTRENVLLELLNQIGSEPCYNQLRTQEQLGYLVWSQVRRSNGTQGFLILVQSTFHPEFLECRIDNFLENLHELIDKMPEDEFQQHRTALMVRKAEKPKRLWERGELLWNEIYSRQLNFDRQNVELKELEIISHQNIVDYFSELVGPPATKRRRLSIHVTSVTKEGAGTKEIDPSTLIVPCKNIMRDAKLIEDVLKWKKEHNLYKPPSPKYVHVHRKDSLNV